MARTLSNCSVAAKVGCNSYGLVIARNKIRVVLDVILMYDGVLIKMMSLVVVRYSMEIVLWRVVDVGVAGLLFGVKCRYPHVALRLGFPWCGCDCP